MEILKHSMVELEMYSIHSLHFICFVTNFHWNCDCEQIILELKMYYSVPCQQIRRMKKLCVQARNMTKNFSHKLIIRTIFNFYIRVFTLYTIIGILGHIRLFSFWETEDVHSKS